MSQPPIRKIIHFDADCFFAAVEMRDRPELADKPLAVGGGADRRGVIATCNYAARAFGVRSAMPTRYALKLCPNLVIVPPDFTRYKAASKAIFDIYRQYSSKVEPLSLDEAYVDVTGSEHCNGSATRIAALICQRVSEEVNLSVSAGVAPNKFLAKIASDWQKPKGLTVIRPDQVDQFVINLPVTKLFGVGPKMAQRLADLQLTTCQDIRQHDIGYMQQHFGKMGVHIYQLAWGIDNREVVTNRVRQSISVETTLLNDLIDFDACEPVLADLYTDLNGRIDTYMSVQHAKPSTNTQGTAGSITLHKAVVKIKTHDFKVRSMERLAVQPTLQTYASLLQQLLEAHPQPIRLLGIGVRLKHLRNDAGQLNLL